MYSSDNIMVTGPDTVVEYRVQIQMLKGLVKGADRHFFIS
jgi:hypothetical protein